MARARKKNVGRSQAGYYPSTGRSKGTDEQPMYRPEFCKQVVEYGKQGWSEAEMAFNGFGVVRSTMRQWAKTHPEFGVALAAAREASQSWWESTGRMNLKRQGFNTNLYNKIITCRFRNDYSDKLTVVGDEDAPIVTRIERVIVRPK